MQAFWKSLLKRNLSNNLLENLRFAVFGLGDSSYIKYNFVAKRLFKRLLQLGAKPLVPLGLGDDQHDLGYEGTSDIWIEDLWNSILQVYPLPKDVEPLGKDFFLPPRWNVRTISGSTKPRNNLSIYYDTYTEDNFTVKILENRRLTRLDHFQDVRLIRLDAASRHYSPGDVISLRPCNLPTQIQEFQDVLYSNGVIIPPDTTFNLTQNDPSYPVPKVLKHNVRFDELCSEYFDLNSIPRRQVFGILAQITDSDLEKEKCLEFTSAEGREDFFNYAYRPKRNIVEVLRDFPNATKNLTKEMLFEILPPIKPRDFSIASNYTYHTNEIHILLAVVKFKTKLKKERIGLASNYLSSVQKGDSLHALIKKGSFRFPKDSDKPVIMVSPGTGVAPFRNYIFERFVNRNSNSDNLILFYGCRYKEKDFLCQEEFTEFQEKGVLKVITAFSRDTPNKVYVQDQIIRNKDLVWISIEKGAYIFVAGNAKNMPQQVRKAFIDVCMESGNLNEQEANQYVQQMEKTGRYQTECW